MCIHAFISKFDHQPITHPTVYVSVYSWLTNPNQQSLPSSISTLLYLLDESSFLYWKHLPTNLSICCSPATCPCDIWPHSSCWSVYVIWLHLSRQEGNAIDLLPTVSRCSCQQLFKVHRVNENGSEDPKLFEVSNLTTLLNNKWIDWFDYYLREVWPIWRMTSPRCRQDSNPCMDSIRVFAPHMFHPLIYVANCVKFNWWLVIDS